MGVDVGSVRVGIAICDPDGYIATPLVTLPAASAQKGLVELIEEYAAVEVVVGLPRQLSGEEGASAQMARAFANELQTLTTIPVKYEDERLTTKAASGQLSQRGVSTKEQKAMIDQIAAASILQSYLDRHRS